MSKRNRKQNKRIRRNLKQFKDITNCSGRKLNRSPHFSKIFYRDIDNNTQEIEYVLQDEIIDKNLESRNILAYGSDLEKYIVDSV